MRFTRIALACMIASLAIVGLTIPAGATIPITLDVSDGYTFSGVQRSVEDDIVISETTIGPFTISGHQPNFVLSWNLGEFTDYPACDPSMPIISVSESIINQVTVHYTADVSSTPGDLVSFELVVPGFTNDGAGVTTIFDLAAIGVSATVDVNDAGTPISIPLNLGSTSQNYDAIYNGVIVTPIEVSGTVAIDVTFTGQVQPALSGNPNQTSLNCPTPNNNLNASSDFGLSQAVIAGAFLQLGIDELPPPPADQPQVIAGPDPLNPGQTLLTVDGTSGNDNIEVKRIKGSDDVEVVVNGQSLGSFAPANRIVVNGQAGDDTLVSDHKLKGNIWLDGGPGNDTIIVNKGSNILNGGDGDDLLISGNKRDILIGGNGSDQLLGQNGSDLLIDGTTSYDDDEFALAAILAEWTAERGFKKRIDNLTGVTTGGLNGDATLIPGSTVFGDSDVDDLFGGNGKDWFFADSTNDNTDAANGDLLNFP